MFCSCSNSQIGTNYRDVHSCNLCSGFLKPYYLEITRSTDPGTAFISTEKYSEENADAFLNIRQIFGSSGFSKGLGELAFLPGYHAKIGVHLDWGAFDEFVKAIEVGVALDVFYKRVPLLVHVNQEVADIMTVSCPHLTPPTVESNPNRPFFLNLYVTLHLGKRY